MMNGHRTNSPGCAHANHSGLSDKHAYMSEIMTVASSISDVNTQRAIELILLLIQDVELSALAKVEKEVGGVARCVEALSDAVARQQPEIPTAPALVASKGSTDLPQTGTMDSLPSLPHSARSESDCSDCSDVASLRDFPCTQACSNPKQHAGSGLTVQHGVLTRVAPSPSRAVLSAKARAQTLDSLPTMRSSSPHVSGRPLAESHTCRSDALQFCSRRGFNVARPVALTRAGKDSTTPSSSGKLLSANSSAQTLDSLPSMSCAPRKAVCFPTDCTPSSSGTLISASGNAGASQSSPLSSSMLTSAHSCGKARTFDSLPLSELPRPATRHSKPSADDALDLPLWLRGVPQAEDATCIRG